MTEMARDGRESVAVYISKLDRGWITGTDGNNLFIVTNVHIQPTNRIKRKHVRHPAT